MHFDFAGCCVGRLDECKVGLWACFGRDEKPGAVGFEVEGRAGFPDAGLEVGVLGSDVDFDGSCSCVACLDVAEIGETVSIGTESCGQPKFKEWQLRRERLI